MITSETVTLLHSDAVTQRHSVEEDKGKDEVSC